MSKQAAHGRADRRARAEPTPNAEKAMREDLARADRALRGVPPVLAHFLVVPNPPLITDEVVARMRGNLDSLARQLIDSTSRAVIGNDQRTGEIEGLSQCLAASSIVLSFCFAQAIEIETTERLEKRERIDPVLSPLLQELIASSSEETAELAMKALTAQSRFVQQQRRMSLSLDELPADIFHEVLRRWEAQSEDHPEVAGGLKQLKGSYDEANGRAALLARLLGTMRKDAKAALDLKQAGFALFSTALAQFSNQPRELAVLSSHESQTARLALFLRAAGLDEGALQQQFLLFAHSSRFPTETCNLAPEEAAAILAEASRPQGG